MDTSDAVTVEQPAAGARRARRLRVGFLAQENLAVPPPVPGSSVARVVHELARGLAAGHDVTVCSLPHPSVPEGRDGDGVRFLRVGARRDRLRHRAYVHALRAARAANLPHREPQGMPFYARGYTRGGLARLARVEPEIVHLQNVCQFLPRARRALPDARLVLHMHCDWLLQLPRSEVRRRLRHASLVLGVSDHVAGGVRERFPELAARCRTLHNGVDAEVFRPRDELPPALRDEAERLRRRLGADGPVFLYVGSMAPEKGTAELLRAFASLLAQVPEATLAIVGRHNRYFQARAPRSRRARAQLRARQRAYPALVAGLAEPLGGRVVFAGGVEHAALPAWYGLADALVMPSTGAEPFGLPVVEAMASGLPVVATRRGGLPEIVVDGLTGLLVPPGEPEPLADALLTLAERPAEAAALGAAGRERALERFTWRHQVERLETYYLELVA